MKLWRLLRGAVVFAVAIVSANANARDAEASTMDSASSAASTSSTNEPNDVAPTDASRMAMSPSLSPSPADGVEAGDETTVSFTPTPTPDLTLVAPNASSDPAALSTKKPTTPSSPPPPPPPMNDINARPQLTPEPDSQIPTVPVPASEPTPVTAPEPTTEPTSEEAPEPTPEPTLEPTPEPTLEPTTEPIPEPTALPDPPQTDKPTPASNPTPMPPPTTQEPESPSPPVAMLPSGPAPVPSTMTDGNPQSFPSPAPSPTLDPDSPSPPRPPQAIKAPSTPTTTRIHKENREAASTKLSLVATRSPEAASSLFVPAVEVHVATDSETSTTSTSSTTTTTTTPRPKAYRRGDQIIIVKKTLADGTIVDVEVVVAPAEAPAILVRSATTMRTGDSDDSTHSRDLTFIVVNRVVPLAALASLVVLVGFHFYAALQPIETASRSVLARPNQWELLVFITYIQAMASTAHYVVHHAPVSLWEFVDAFSWTVFIPFHHSINGVSNGSNTVSRRRLANVMILDGLVAFSDRVGVDETELLQTSAAGLVICCGAVGLLACAVVLRIKFKTWTNPSTTKSGSLVPGATHLVHSLPASDLSPVYVVYGLLVVVGVFALYPVTLMATFEIASQVRVTQVSGSSLAVALLVLMLVSVQLVLRSISALVSIPNENEFKTHTKHRVVWGVLSSSECVKYKHRVTTAITWLAMQLTSAMLVGSVLSDMWQLGLLLAVDLLFVGVMLVVRPFATGHRLALIFTCTIGMVKAINTSFAFAFVTQSSASSAAHQNASAAKGFIIVNALAITLWFVRIATIAFLVVRNAIDQRVPARGRASPNGDVNCDGNYNSTLFVALPSTRDGHHGPRQAIL